MAAKKREWKAWAIVMPNGKLAWTATWRLRKEAKGFADPGERIIRVRIVEA